MDLQEAEQIIAGVRALADRWNSATVIGVLTGKNQPDIIAQGFAEQLYAVLPEGNTVKTWTFYWLDGKREVLDGPTAVDALNRAGYGRGALAALDFHAEGDRNHYEWDPAAHTWNKTETETSIESEDRS